MNLKTEVKQLNSSEEIGIIKSAIGAQVSLLDKLDADTNFKDSILKKNKEKLESLEENNYEIKVTNGKQYIVFSSSTSPTEEELEEVKTAYLEEIRAARKERVAPVIKSQEKLGFEYQLHNGVFLSPNAVKNMLTDPEVNMKRIKKEKVPFKKDTYIGVELECIIKVTRSKLEEMFIADGLAGYVHLKTDHSLRTEGDGEAAVEVTCLFPLRDSSAILKRITDTLAKAKAYVNNSCGTHVHLDARDKDKKHMFTNLVSSLPLLQSLVPKKRITNEYCKVNTSKNLDDYTTGSSRHARYWAVNPLSLEKHGTIEVRLLHGTVNFWHIKNWVNLISTIAYNKEALALTHPNQLLAITDDNKLIDYANKKYDHFIRMGDNADNKSEHFYVDALETAV